MSRLVLTILAVCGVGAAGCQSTSSPESASTSMENESIAPILHEGYTGFSKPARFVVREAAEWVEVWRRAYVGRSEVPERPEIDFSREMVVVAAQGARPSGGHDIGIERVAAGDGELKVYVLSTSPAPSCGVLTVITSPVVMVRVTRWQDVQFVEKSRTAPCE